MSRGWGGNHLRHAVLVLSQPPQHSVKNLIFQHDEAGHTCFTSNAPQVKFGGLFVCLFFFLNNLIQEEMKLSSNQKANQTLKSQV